MEKNFDWMFYRQILNQIHSNIYITDVETDEIVYMNDYMKRAYQVFEPEGKICWKVLQRDMNKRCEFCKISELLSHPEKKEVKWKECSTLTGKTYMNYDTIEMWEGKCYHIQNSVDITEKVQLSVDATIDELTTLLNRQAGRKMLSQILQKLGEKEHFIISLLDINGLKWVNDSYGHLEGDRLLRYVATSLKNNLDDTDFIFRLSGDEFIIIFMNKEIYQADQWMKNALERIRTEKHKIGIYYEASFSYGLAKIRGEDGLGVSDILSIADTQMYIQKRDYHIAQGHMRLRANPVTSGREKKDFEYNREYLFEAFSDCADGYAFIGNLKTGEFMYSSRMVADFGLPVQVLSNAASFWGERIHPEDRELFLRSNQEIADGKAEKHTIAYRARNKEGKWIHLICKGKMIRDETGSPDLFAGVIRNLDNQEMAKNLTTAGKSSFYFVKERGRNSIELEDTLLDFVSRNLPGGIMATHDDDELTMICFNQAVLEYTDSTYDELMQKTRGKGLRLVYEEERERVRKEIAQQLAEKDLYEINYRVACKNGHFAWIYEVGRYAVNDSGKKCILSFFIDVSQEKEKEIELNFISDNSMGGVFKVAMTDSFPVLYANDGYYRIHGYTRMQMEKELHGRAASLVHPDDAERINHEIEETIANKKEQIVLEHRIVRRNGSIAWIHVEGGMTRLANGSFVMVGMVLDITRRHKLEEKLVHTKELYNHIRNHTKLNVWEFDLKKRIVYIDRNEEQVFSGKQIIRDIPEWMIQEGYVHSDSISTFREGHERVISGEEKTEFTVQMKHSNGECRWEKITYIGMKDEKNEPVWAVGISEDVTVQKEAEIRAFNQEKMGEIMAKDTLYSFRINLTRNCLEGAWNENGERFDGQKLKISYEEIYAKICSTIANEDDRKRFESYFSPEKMAEYIDCEGFAKEFEFRQSYRNETIIWVNLNFKIIVSPSAGEKILFAYAKNIDLLRKRELSIQKKTEIDEISGLYNPGTTKILVESIIGDKSRKAEESIFMLLNVDEFKEVNRIAGFAAGDSLLRQMGDIIHKQSPTASVAGRLTGDNFIVFIYGMKTKKEAYEEAQKLRKLLCRKYICEGMEFELTVSAGATYLIAQSMTYDRLYQRSYHALEAVRRGGGNALIFYDQIESGEPGQEIRMNVHPETYEVLSMNTNGMVVFGYQGITEITQKCYEILHNRTSPCPFCTGELGGKKKHEWDCFVPRLNRLMHVDEQIEKNGQKDVRAICMRVASPLAMEHLHDQEISAIFRQSWRRIESGENAKSVYYTIVEYIGKSSNAEEATLLARNTKNGDLQKVVSWNAHKKGETYTILPEKLYLLEKLFRKVFPVNCIFVQEKRSVGYEELLELYGVDELEYPVFIAGHYDGDRLAYVLFAEKCDAQIVSASNIESVMEMIRRIGYLYKVRRNYEYVLKHDNNTGMLNYESYIKRIEYLNEDAMITFGMIGVRMINMKEYNRKYGNVRGDESLVFLAGLLRESFGEENCFRVSRTEFTVLCEDMTYEQFLERYRAVEAKAEQVLDEWVVMANTWEQYSISVENMREQLEEKLHVARNRKEITEKHISGRTTLEMLREMQQNMKDGRFRIFLQPKVDVATGKLCGAEALIRFLDDDKGIIPPGRFLPAVERAGLIRYIDLYALNEVCRMIRSWIDKGEQPVTISVNYSRSTILEPDILEETNRILESFGVPRELLEIEITETIGSVDNISLKGIIDRFSEAGYKIALDDYGAEYSNIYVLYSLSLNTLKIDRRIISDIYHDKKARMMVESVIDICKKFNIVCVAEGVETREQMDLLKEMSCDVIQGYYINKPLPEEEFCRQYIYKN